MDRKNNDFYIISLVSVSCIAMIFEGIALGWEFWVNPIIFLGTVALWTMYITERPQESIREIYYLIYVMLAVFYHGVHETSYVDIAIVTCFVMVAYSLLDHIYMMNILLVEYLFIFVIQLWFVFTMHSIELNFLTITRTMLHVVAVFYIYAGCVKSILIRLNMRSLLDQKDKYIDDYDNDIEDFLTNISHELRTPVNVVSGMSDLLLKKDEGEEVKAIKNAGLRLASQIEDIQDYTETRRNSMILEKENYMSTSLINDVVTFFRMQIPSDSKIELIVDLSPEVPTTMHGDVKKLRKVFRHLIENSIKFTRNGGIYVRLYCENKDYGVNLCIEVSDTGIGLKRQELTKVSKGFYQANKKRDRSSGGIGLGLSIVYGFVHKMDGFVKIESEYKKGTTVRVTIPQKVVDSKPCLSINDSFGGDILLYLRSDKYPVPKVRDFYRVMAANVAAGINTPLYLAETVNDVEHFLNKLNVSYIFMEEEEYTENADYFDKLSNSGIIIAVSANEAFKVNANSKVLVMPKPLYAYHIVKVLNEGIQTTYHEFEIITNKTNLNGIKALVVDDEPMNLVVASGLFKNYGMIVDTANSCKNAIAKYRSGDYDIVFMDHMMPEMDGVEAMHRIKLIADEMGKDIPVIALTANVVSGAREMFATEGFNGFIGKPIDLLEFEHVMSKVISQIKKN